MLVETSTYKNDYIANGSTTTFAIRFPFLDSAHVEVYTRFADKETRLEPTQYTISGAGNEAGGSVTLNSAPTNGTRVTILRNVPLTQLYAYEELDNFPAKSHEDALAKLTMITQQLQEQLERSVVLTPTDPRDPIELMEQILATGEYAEAQADLACQCADEACAQADRAEKEADRARDEADRARDEADRSRDEADRATQIAKLSFATSNYEAAWELKTNLPVDSIIDLPFPYFTGRNMLQMSYDGLKMVRGQQYIEVPGTGADPEASTQVQIKMPLEKGMIVHFWAIASNQARGAEEAAERAEAARDEAIENANRAYEEAERTIEEGLKAIENIRDALRRAQEALISQKNENLAEQNANKDKSLIEIDNARLDALDDIEKELVDALAKQKEETARAWKEAERACECATNSCECADAAFDHLKHTQDAASDAQDAADRADDAAIDAGRYRQDILDLLKCLQVDTCTRSLISITSFGSIGSAPNGFIVINPFTGIGGDGTGVFFSRGITPILGEDEIPILDGFYVFTPKFPECSNTPPIDPDDPDKPVDPDNPEDPDKPITPPYDSLENWTLPCGARKTIV